MRGLVGAHLNMPPHGNFFSRLHSNLYGHDPSPMHRRKITLVIFCLKLNV
jgi:hypothetical protein